MTFGLTSLPTWGLLGGIAAVAGAAAVFYRRRGRVVVGAGGTVLARGGRPLDVRSVSTLLRSLYSLAIQLLIVALVLTALADPFPQRNLAKRLIVVIDAGATMQTQESPGKSRFDLARELASKRIEASAR